MTDIGEYRLLGKLGEGTFSEVLRVRNKKNGKTIEDIENLREIQALRRLNHHPNIIQLEEVIFDAKYGILSLAFEIMDNNLFESLSRKGQPPIHEHRCKWVLWQVMKALDFVHSKGIFHRDIKPENILVRGDIHAVPIPFPSANPSSPYHSISSFPIVKLADFGSCRGIHSRMPYTEYIATRWYRSPECLLFNGIYSYKMDVWGVGCVLFELLTKVPLFPGDNELDQLHRIHHVMGSPSERLLKSMVASGHHALLNGVATTATTGNTAATNASNSKDASSSQAAKNASTAAMQLMREKEIKSKNIFKRQYAFPPTKGIGIRAVIPPHVLHGSQKVNQRSPGQGGGYSPADYPGLSDEAIHLTELMLQYDPDARPTARHSLKHPWLKECRDAEALEKQEAETSSDHALTAVPTSLKTTTNTNPSNVTGPPTNNSKTTTLDPKQVAIDPSKMTLNRRLKAGEKSLLDVDFMEKGMKPQGDLQPAILLSHAAPKQQVHAPQASSSLQASNKDEEVNLSSTTPTVARKQLKANPLGMLGKAPALTHANVAAAAGAKRLPATLPRRTNNAVMAESGMAAMSISGHSNALTAKHNAPLPAIPTLAAPNSILGPISTSTKQPQPQPHAATLQSPTAEVKPDLPLPPTVARAIPEESPSLNPSQVRSPVEPSSSSPVKSSSSSPVDSSIQPNARVASPVDPSSPAYVLDQSTSGDTEDVTRPQDTRPRVDPIPPIATPVSVPTSETDSRRQEERVEAADVNTTTVEGMESK